MNRTMVIFLSALAMTTIDGYAIQLPVVFSRLFKPPSSRQSLQTSDIKTLEKILSLDPEYKNQWSDPTRLHGHLMQLFNLSFSRTRRTTDLGYEIERIAARSSRLADERRGKFQRAQDLTTEEIQQFAASVMIHLYIEYSKNGSIQASRYTLIDFLSSPVPEVVASAARFLSEHFVGVEPGHSFLPDKAEVLEQAFSSQAALNAIVFMPDSLPTWNGLIQEFPAATWQLHVDVAHGRIQIQDVGRIILKLFERTVENPNSIDLVESANRVLNDLRRAASDDPSKYKAGSAQAYITEARIRLANLWLEKIRDLISSNTSGLGQKVCPLYLN